MEVFSYANMLLSNAIFSQKYAKNSVFLRRDNSCTNFLVSSVYRLLIAALSSLAGLTECEITAAPR